jgi:hypothetical protein
LKQAKVKVGLKEALDKAGMNFVAAVFDSS